MSVMFSVNLFCFLYVFDIVSMFTENMFIRCTLDDTEIKTKLLMLMKWEEESLGSCIPRPDCMK